MGLRYLCVERCYQPVFSSDNPNLCMLYEPDNEYVFPESAVGKVPERYFDLIDGKPETEANVEQEKPIKPEAHNSAVDYDQQPVETLMRMSDGIQAGLNAEGIRTIGDLRKILTSKDGDKLLLESEHLAVGPARLLKFKKALGIAKEDD